MLHVKYVTYAVASIVISLLGTLIVLEVLLRQFPVSDGPRGVPVNEANPVYRFAPNRTYTYSKGWNFSLVNEGRINNYGFVHQSDYDPTDTSPLLAVIGDSFVQASMVPFHQTVTGRLQETVGRRGRVYSFAAVGAALSQYLAYARYARDELRPDGLVVVIVGNDFDESLMKYRTYPGFHYFVKQADGRLSLHRVDRSIPAWKDVLMMSAVGRYVILNLELGNTDRLRQLAAPLIGERPHSVGNVDATPDPVRIMDSQQAVDYFLRSLPEMIGLSRDRIVLVLDAPRPEVYSPRELAAVQESFFGVMRRYFIQEASLKGFDVIDLEPVFQSQYRKHGRRFEYPNDYHWNELGHELVSGLLRQTILFLRLFDGEKT